MFNHQSDLYLIRDEKREKASCCDTLLLLENIFLFLTQIIIFLDMDRWEWRRRQRGESSDTAIRWERERKLGTISFLVTNEFYFSETGEKLLWKTSEEPHWRKMRRTTSLRTLHTVKWNRKLRETELICVLQL